MLFGISKTIQLKVRALSTQAVSLKAQFLATIAGKLCLLSFKILKILKIIKLYFKKMLVIWYEFPVNEAHFRRKII